MQQTAPRTAADAGRSIEKMKKVSVCKLNDGGTHCRLMGPSNGPVAVLVHGGTVPSWIWDTLAGHLAATGYRVLTYDQFGRGLSERPKVVYDRVATFLDGTHGNGAARTCGDMPTREPGTVDEYRCG